MESDADKRLTTAFLASRVSEDADATQIADAIVSTWRAVDAALTPVIGQHGVASLYKRSLYLVKPAYPWIAGIQEGVHTAMDLAALKSALVLQDSNTAATAGGAVLQTFYEVLNSLIGPSLTERLLGSVWERFKGATSQDPPA